MYIEQEAIPHEFVSIFFIFVIYTPKKKKKRNEKKRVVLQLNHNNNLLPLKPFKGSKSLSGQKILLGFNCPKTLFILYHVYFHFFLHLLRVIGYYYDLTVK